MRLLVPWNPLLSSQPGTCPTLSHRLLSSLYLFLQWSSTSEYWENSGWPASEGMQLLLVIGSFPKSDSWLRDDSNDNQATCIILPWLQPIFCLCFLLTVNFSPKYVSFSYSYLMLREVSCIYLMKPGCRAPCLLFFLSFPPEYVLLLKTVKDNFNWLRLRLPWGPLLSPVTSSVCQGHLEYWMSSKVSGVTGYILMCCLYTPKTFTRNSVILLWFSFSFCTV